MASASTESSPIAHRNLAVIETEDEATLDRLFSASPLRHLLWLRLGATRALTDPEAIDQLVEYLEKSGLPPRFCYELSAGDERTE